MEQDVSTLPPFANELNKALDVQRREKERKLNGLSAEIQELSVRLGYLSTHAQNIERELKSTQSMYNARNDQISNEIHAKKVVERSIGKVEKEIKEQTKEGEELNAKITNKVKEINRIKEQLDQYNRELEENQNQYMLWVKEEQEKENNRYIIEKYQRIDEMKVKEISLSIERLSKKVSQKKAILNNLETEKLSSHIEIEKIRKNFQRVSKEHQKLVEELNNILNQISAKNKQIDTSSSRYEEVIEQIRVKREKNIERDRFLQSEIQSNQKIEVNIENVGRSIIKKRTLMENTKKEETMINDQIETVKGEISRTKELINQKKSSITRYKELSKNQQDKIVRETEKLNDAKERRSEWEKNSELSKENKLKSELFLKEQEANLTRISKEIEILKQNLFKESEALNQKRKGEANLISDFNGIQKSKKIIQAQIAKLDNESLKQREVLYSQEFKIQEMETKINRSQGKRTNEEKIALNQKINELTDILNEENTKYDIVKKQRKKVQDELNTIKRKTIKIKDKKAKTDERILELQKLIENSEKRLLQISLQKNEKLIEENFVRLDLKRLRDVLYKKSDEIFSLEVWKRQTNADIEEMASATKAEILILSSKLKAAKEELHVLKIEQKKKEATISKLMKRYEILLSYLNVEDKDDVVEKSQVYYLSKFALEKEELLKEGENLNESINKKEKNIKALEDTLNAICVINANLKTHTQTSRMNVQEIEEKADKEERISEIKAEIEEKKKTLKNLRNESESFVGENKFNLESLKIQMSDISEMETKLKALNKEIVSYNDKLERAQVIYRRLVNEQKKLFDHDSENPNRLPIITELKLKRKKDLQNETLLLFANVIRSHPELIEPVRAILKESGFEFPENESAPSAHSSRSSTRSTMYSSSSVRQTPQRTFSAASKASIKPVQISFSQRHSSEVKRKPSRDSTGRHSPSISNSTTRRSAHNVTLSIGGNGL